MCVCVCVEEELLYNKCVTVWMQCFCVLAFLHISSDSPYVCRFKVCPPVSSCVVTGHKRQEATGVKEELRRKEKKTRHSFHLHPSILFAFWPFSVTPGLLYQGSCENDLCLSSVQQKQNTIRISLLVSKVNCKCSVSVSPVRTNQHMTCISLGLLFNQRWRVGSSCWCHIQDRPFLIRALQTDSSRYGSKSH